MKYQDAKELVTVMLDAFGADIDPEVVTPLVLRAVEARKKQQYAAHVFDELAEIIHKKLEE